MIDVHSRFQGLSIIGGVRGQLPGTWRTNWGSWLSTKSDVCKQSKPRKRYCTWHNPHKRIHFHITLLWYQVRNKSTGLLKDKQCTWNNKNVPFHRMQWFQQNFCFRLLCFVLSASARIRYCLRQIFTLSCRHIEEHFTVEWYSILLYDGFLAVQTRVWQLNRWPCHSLTHWVTDWVSHFWFWNIRQAIDCQRNTQDTCDLWDIWSKWIGDMSWQTKRQIQRQWQRKIHLENSIKERS